MSELLLKSIKLKDGGLITLSPAGLADANVLWCTVIKESEKIFAMATLVEIGAQSTDEFKVVSHTVFVESLKDFIEKSFIGVDTQTALENLKMAGVV